MIRDSGYTVQNVAICGQTTQMMIDSCRDVNALLTTNTILIVDECTNDLYINRNDSVGLIFNKLKKYCDDRRLVANIKIVVVLPTPRENVGTPVDFEVKRQLLIARIKAASFYDALANAGENPMIGLFGCDRNPIYYTDSVHHTDLGYQIRGSIIYNVIKKIN